MDISVIIVNYNAARCLPACLDALLMQQNIHFEIIVVDNHSTDTSHQILSHYLDSQGSHGKLKVIFEDQNWGFGKANNIGAQQAKGKYLFLLNPDAELTTAHDLARLVSWFEKHAEAQPPFGLIGTAIENPNGRFTAPKKVYPYHHCLKKSLDNLPGQIAWVIGASMMLPHAIFKQLHGFDEEFFLYGEETDLCIRIRAMGLQIGYCPEVRVLHIGSVSETGNNAYQVTSRKQDGIFNLLHKHYDSAKIKKALKKELYRAYFRYYTYKIRMGCTIGDINKQLHHRAQHYLAIIDTTKFALTRTTR